MTAKQQAWLCSTSAHVRSVSFHAHDAASALLLTRRHKLHARLQEAHNISMPAGKPSRMSDPVLPTEGVAVVGLFRSLRVLSFTNASVGCLTPALVQALPRTLEELGYLSWAADTFVDTRLLSNALNLAHLDRLQRFTLVDEEGVLRSASPVCPSEWQVSCRCIVTTAACAHRQ